MLLEPCAEPQALLATVIRVLAEGNQAKRVELDWQAQTEARCFCGFISQSQGLCFHMLDASTYCMNNCMKSNGMSCVCAHPISICVCIFLGSS